MNGVMTATRPCETLSNPVPRTPKPANGIRTVMWPVLLTGLGMAAWIAGTELSIGSHRRLAQATERAAQRAPRSVSAAMDPQASLVAQIRAQEGSAWPHYASLTIQRAMAGSESPAVRTASASVQPQQQPPRDTRVPAAFFPSTF